MDPKKECELLMNSLTPVADKMLSEHGEFYPYGAVLEKSGDIRQIAASDGTETPPSKPMIEHLVNRIRKLAKMGDILASGIVYDAKILLPDSEVKSDAIVIELEHISNYSVKVMAAYSKSSDGKINYKPMISSPGTNNIFSKSRINPGMHT